MGWLKNPFKSRQTAASRRTRGPSRKDLARISQWYGAMVQGIRAVKSIRANPDATIPTPRFGLNYQSGIVEPQMEYTFTQQYQIVETNPTWRTATQLHIDVNRIHPVEVVAVGENVEPDKAEMEIATNLLNLANRWGQTMEEVLGEDVEAKLNCNNAWLYAVGEYRYSGDTEGQKHEGLDPETVEIFWGDPRIIRWSYDEELNPTWVRCPVHDRVIQTYRPDEPQFCYECGAVMYPVVAVAMREEGNVSDIARYYIKNEIWHSGLNASGSGGVLYYTPHIHTLKYPVGILNALWEYLYHALYEKEMPDQFVAVMSDNPPAVMDWAAQARTVTQEQNPWHIPVLPVFSNNGKGKVEVINMLDTLLQKHGDIEADCRNAIAGYLGCTPLFLADVAESAGLNNESQQVYVVQMKGEAVLRGQNNGIFPWMARLLGFQTVTFRRQSVWVEGETERVARLTAEAALAQTHLDMNGKVDFDGQHYVLAKGPLSKPRIQQGGTFTRDAEKAADKPRPVDQIRGDRERVEDQMVEELERMFFDEIQKVQIDKDRKPTRAELEKIVRATVKTISDRWGVVVETGLENLYKLSVELALAEMATPMGPWTADNQADADAFIRDSDGVRSWLKNYREVDQQVIDVIADHLGRDSYSHDELVQDLLSKEGVLAVSTRARIETMARTEFAQATDRARKSAYKDMERRTGEVVKVTMHGPFECDACQAVIRAIRSKGGGVTMDELEDLVKRYGQAPRGWRCHPNCKCTITRWFP